MSRTLYVFISILFICLAVAAFGGLVWANTDFLHNQPISKDFLVPWLGARTFIQYGESPYSEPATQRAQIIYYGQLASKGEDSLILWLPLPFELFYFPFAFVPDYILARAIWMTCNEIALVALAFLSLRLTDWKPWRALLPVLLLFPIFWIYGAMSLISSNASGFVALAIAGFLLAVRSERDELAGGLLILLVGALRFTGILLFFIAWWIIYQRRWRVFWGFGMGGGVLLGLAFLFLPSWVLDFLRGLISHVQFNAGLSSTGIFASWSPVVGQRSGWVLAAILLLVLFFEWGNSLSKDFRAFLWMTSLTLSVTPLLGIPMELSDFSFFFIPLILFLAILSERNSSLKSRGVTLICLLILLIGPWLLTVYWVRANAFSLLTNVLFLFLPLFVMVSLIWTRWWFTRTVPLGLENKP